MRRDAVRIRARCAQSPHPPPACGRPVPRRRLHAAVNAPAVSVEAVSPGGARGSRPCSPRCPGSHYCQRVQDRSGMLPLLVLLALGCVGGARQVAARTWAWPVQIGSAAAAGLGAWGWWCGVAPGAGLPCAGVTFRRRATRSVRRGQRPAVPAWGGWTCQLLRIRHTLASDLQVLLAPPPPPLPPGSGQAPSPPAFPRPTRRLACRAHTTTPPPHRRRRRRRRAQKDISVDAPGPIPVPRYVPDPTPVKESVRRPTEISTSVILTGFWDLEGQVGPRPLGPGPRVQAPGSRPLGPSAGAVPVGPWGAGGGAVSGWGTLAGRAAAAAPAAAGPAPAGRQPWVASPSPPKPVRRLTACRRSTARPPASLWWASQSLRAALASTLW